MGSSLPPAKSKQPKFCCFSFDFWKRIISCRRSFSVFLICIDMRTQKKQIIKAHEIERNNNYSATHLVIKWSKVHCRTLSGASLWQSTVTRHTKNKASVSISWNWVSCHKNTGWAHGGYTNFGYLLCTSALTELVKILHEYKVTCSLEISNFHWAKHTLCSKAQKYPFSKFQPIGQCASAIIRE